MSRGAYGYFMATFLADQLVRMVILNSAKLRARGMQATTAGEVLKFLGVVILATRYEFGAGADLWVTKPRSKYLLAPAFGERTDLPRSRFEALWSCATFSAQSAEGDATEKGRWELIDDFVAAMNADRAARVVSSEVICVDYRYASGTAREAMKFKRGFRCTWHLAGNLRRDEKSKTRPVLEAELCSTSRW